MIILIAFQMILIVSGAVDNDYEVKDNDQMPYDNDNDQMPYDKDND